MNCMDPEKSGGPSKNSSSCPLVLPSVSLLVFQALPAKRSRSQALAGPRPPLEGWFFLGNLLEEQKDVTQALLLLLCSVLS